MTHRPPRRRSESTDRDSAALAPRLVEWLRLALLAATTALLVVTPLMPSEAVTSFGVNAPVTMSWLVLLVGWAALSYLQPGQKWAWGWPDLALLALVVWHSIAGLVALRTGNPRSALNITWLWIGLAASIWLVRQLARTPVERKALVAAMLALGVVLSAHGGYQFFYSGPKVRSDFKRDPAEVMRRAGIYAQPGSLEADQFRNRISSVEPLASFALTNSLAGYLAPWIVVSLGVGFAAAGRIGSDRRALAATCVIAAILAGCLVFTKSRTGVLATAAGCGLLMLFCRPAGLQLSWRTGVVLGGAATAILGSVVIAKGLDRLVLTEAPKSFTYRLEYWQATSAMIAEHPWLGVGPGNFQEWYTRYKLPQASETVADPHNYWFEIAANAGLPALLLLAVWHGAMLAPFFRREALTKQPTLAPPKPAAKAERLPDPRTRYAVYGGLALGLFLVFPFDLVVDFLPEGVEPLGGFPVAWLIGAPLAALVLWALDGWVQWGTLPPRVLGVALVALGVNLLAAGSLYFPGVIVSACVLIPLLLPLPEGDASQPRQPILFSQLAILLAIVLVALAYLSFYSPLLTALARKDAYLAASSHGNSTALVETLATWKQADPWSPEPWRQQAEQKLQQWIATGEKTARAGFLESAEQALRLSGASSRQADQLAQWYWIGWKKKRDREFRDLALQHWKLASERYPSGGFQHAQYAWALHSLGDAERARSEAERALEFDSRNPHREQKLGQRYLFDLDLQGGELHRPESAEVSMHTILQER